MSETPEVVAKQVEKAAVRGFVNKRPCIQTLKNGTTGLEAIGNKTAPTEVDMASNGLPKVDIFLNPNEQDRVENISAMKRGIAKNYFDNANATKLYPKLFEILWESTLP